MIEINLTEEGKKVQPIFFSASLLVETRQAILDLSQELKDGFTWTYAEMPRLDLQLVTHKLNNKEGTRVVKQISRNFKLELEVQIKQKIQKLLNIGFIKPIQHQTWLVNIISVKKKNGHS